MPDVVCVGEMLIDFVATVGGTTIEDTPVFERAPGGAPANVAVGLSRLGLKVAFMGKVGDDPFGYFLTDTLAAAGVDVGSVRFAKEARTGLAFVSLGAGGEREFTFYRHPSADMLWTPDEVDVDLIRDAKLVHFGSISLIGEPSRSATLRAVELAEKAGALVSYDPNLRPALWGSPAEAKAGMLLGWPRANIIKVSEEEARYLTGETDLIRAGRSLWHDRLQLMTITLGHRGCIYLTSRFEGLMDGIAVEPVDTTGAGDGFFAGLLRGVLMDPGALDDELRLREICRFANIVAALTTTGRGAIPALPDLARVQRFVDQTTA
jgi:fructokinase